MTRFPYSRIFYSFSILIGAGLLSQAVPLGAVVERAADEPALVEPSLPIDVSWTHERIWQR